MNGVPSAFQRVLAVVILVVAGYAVGCVAGCLSEDCDNRGPSEVGCGSGENGCVQSSKTACESDSAKTLGSGLFGCGTEYGKCDCENSTQYQDVCYIEWSKCDWVEDRTPKCKPDDDYKEEYNDWVKESDDCV